MASRDIIVIGASAGGVEALTALARVLPPDFSAALFAVLHVAPHGNSVLPQLLSRAGFIGAEHAIHGDKIVPGRWYVAPPDQHLLIREDCVHLGRGPSENGHRPAIDPLFRSAASSYGSRVIGVVLSGALDDGTAGLLAVKQSGGVTIVQEPTEALHPSMPLSAIEHVKPDHILPVADIGAKLTQLTREPGSVSTRRVEADPEHTGTEAAIADEGQAAIEELDSRGVPSGFACPDCHGVLWEVREGDLVRYRCRVGHAYLPQALSVAQSEQLEESLWIALRTLKESSSLSKRLAERARERKMLQMAVTYETRAREAAQRAAVIEDVLKRGRLSASVEEANATEAGRTVKKASSH
jgi:two-component system chemotaxis response regulator CheB